MRIAHVKKSFSRRSYPEDEIDRLHNKEFCHNCNCKKTILYRINNDNVTIKVCENFNCFLFINVDNLKNKWIKQEQNK